MCGEALDGTIPNCRARRRVLDLDAVDKAKLGKNLLFLGIIHPSKPTRETAAAVMDKMLANDVAQICLGSSKI